MIVMCAWCKTESNVKSEIEAPGPLGESGKKKGRSLGKADGICADCRAEYFPETLRTVQENAQALLAQFKRAL
jgi:hypothetical protein